MFISYARTDRDYAANIANLLQGAGISVWLDDRIDPGTHFDEVIEAALDGADKVIVIWSAASVKSQWVRAEAGEGLRRGILVPIAADLSKIPLEFRRVQALDFSGWSGDPASPEFRALERFLDPLKAASSTVESKVSPPTKSVRADLVSADRYHHNIRIRMYVGKRSYRVDYEGVGSRQLLKLDGKVIAEGGTWVRLEDYFRCENVAPDVEVLELSLHGNAIRGIDHVALRVNGSSVISTALPLSKGIEFVLIFAVIAVIMGTASGRLLAWGGPTVGVLLALIVTAAFAILFWKTMGARRPPSS